MNMKRRIFAKTLLLIVVLSVVGCLGAKVSIKISDSERDVNRENVYYQEFTFKSIYSGAQKVTINLSTNDPRIGVSWNDKNFQQSIIMEREIGKDYENIERFYFSVKDQNIPNGKYEITAKITGEKSGDSNSAKLTVGIGFQ